MRAGSLVFQDHVVLRRAVDLVDSQLRFFPLEPIGALGVAGALYIGAVASRARQAAVVHAEDTCVFEDGYIAGEASLPGLVENERGALEARVMELEGCSLELMDEVSIDKEFAAGAKRHSGLFSRPRAGYDGRYRGEEEDAECFSAHGNFRLNWCCRDGGISVSGQRVDSRGNW